MSEVGKRSALDCRLWRLTNLTDLSDSTVTCHDTLQLMMKLHG
jgi:hypothetical protein